MADIDEFVAEKVVEARARASARRAKEDARRAAAEAEGAARLKALRDAIPARMRQCVTYRNGRAEVALPGCAVFVIMQRGDGVVAVFPSSKPESPEVAVDAGDLVEVIALARSIGEATTSKR